MAELTRTRHLLAQLLQLGGDDAQLPAEVLVNLHRIQLRAPLLRLAQLSEQTTMEESMREKLHTVHDILNERYPRLQAGKVFENNDALSRLGAREVALEGVWDLGKMQVVELTGSELVAELVDLSSYNWYAHEPLYTLHRLTWPNAPLGILLETLEVELSLEYQVGQLILELGEPGDGQKS